MPYDPLGFFVNMIFPFADPSRDKFWKCVTTIPKKTEDDKRDGNAAINNGAQSEADLLKLIDKRRNWFGAGVYAGLATYRFADTTKRTKDGWPYIPRKKENVVSLNSFWLDVDVDPNKPNCYKTRDDALAGWSKFLNEGHMPPPSMIVNSGGGGFHVYWCTAEPMDLATWQPLADALKEKTKAAGLIVDGKCTADAARILRIPTTYNWKSGDRVDVELVHPTTVLQYSVNGLAIPLQRFIAVRSSTTQAQTGTGAPVVASQWTQNFAGGLKDDDRTLPALTIDQIAVACPATAQTLLDGGVGKSEPDWNNDVYLAAWTSDPVDAAHRLSKGYNGYDVTKTDKKLAEKQAAIAGSTTMGWPKCASFNHAACKTCPYLPANRSPIFFAHQLASQRDAQIPNKGYAVDDLMPAGYWRNDKNYVFTDSDTGPINVLGYPVHDAGIDESTSKSEIVVRTTIANRQLWRNVNLVKSTAAGVCEAWLKAGIAITGDQKVVRTFSMAWIKHLQNVKRERRPMSLGWHGDNFVFGDDMFTPAGVEPAYVNGKDDTRFKRVGELKPWTDAMQHLIYGRTGLEIIVAGAFAAPLMELAYDFTSTLSAYSPVSGIGKSTAMKCGQTVWGTARGGMSMLDDTKNATVEKAAMLKNLPVFWDEIKGDEQITQLAHLVMQLAQGQNKARMNAKAQNQPVGTMTTLLIAAANESIFEEVLRRVRNTQAAGLRVFEYEVPAYPTTMTSSEAERLMVRLRDNYGCPGAVYAEFLVLHKAAVREIIAAVQDQLKPCAFTQQERFWEAILVTLLAGAHIANQIKLTQFNIEAMQAFLLQALKTARSGLASESHTFVSAGAEDEIIAKLIGSTRHKNLVVTETIRQNVGPGGRQLAQTANHSASDVSKVQDAWIQLGELDDRILMRVTAFNEWVEQQKLRSPRQVLGVLQRTYDIEKVKRTIGAGVVGIDLGRQAWCWLLSPKVSRNPSSPSASSGSPVLN